MEAEVLDLWDTFDEHFRLRPEAADASKNARAAVARVAGA